MRRTIPVYFSHVSLLGAKKPFSCRPESRRLEYLNVCVCVSYCVYVHVCVCVRKAVIMRIISQSWERAVPGYHTQPLSHTSTGRTGGPGSGDYRSNTAGTGTQRERLESSETLQLWGRGSAQDRAIEHGETKREKTLKRGKNRGIKIRCGATCGRWWKKKVFLW